MPSTNVSRWDFLMMNHGEIPMKTSHKHHIKSLVFLPHFCCIFLWLNNCRCVHQKNNNVEQIYSSTMTKQQKNPRVSCKTWWTSVQPTAQTACRDPSTCSWIPELQRYFLKTISGWTQTRDLHEIQDSHLLPFHDSMFQTSRFDADQSERFSVGPDISTNQPKDRPTNQPTTQPPVGFSFFPFMDDVTTMQLWQWALALQTPSEILQASISSQILWGINWKGGKALKKRRGEADAAWRKVLIVEEKCEHLLFR